MKHKKIFRTISFLIVQIILINAILTSCGLFGGLSANRYFRELNDAYSYDFSTGVLKKFSSEIEVDEKNEFLTFSGNNTKPLAYDTVNVPLADSGKTINVTYTLHDGKLIIAEIPVIANTQYRYSMIGDSTDKFIAIHDDDIYLVNLSDLSAEYLYSFAKGTVSQTIAISPDGKYMSFFVDLSTDADTDEAVGGSSGLYVFDIESRKESRDMNFNYKAEFLCWTKDSSGFLYREKIFGIDGIERYSSLYKYSISSQTSSTIFEVNRQYEQYELIDDEYIYAYSYKSSHMNGVLYIRNIYTQEVTAVVLPRYAIIWEMVLSETKEYAALCALYVDANGYQVSRLISVNLETNDIRFYYEIGYETGLENYGMHSFYWLPDNILIVNFLNTMDLYQDLCRFHKVKHTKSNIPKLDLEDVIAQDTASYEEEIEG